MDRYGRFVSSSMGIEKLSQKNSKSGYILLTKRSPIKLGNMIMVLSDLLLTHVAMGFAWVIMSFLFSKIGESPKTVSFAIRQNGNSGNPAVRAPSGLHYICMYNTPVHKNVHLQHKKKNSCNCARGTRIKNKGTVFFATLSQTYVETLLMLTRHLNLL